MDPSMQNADPVEQGYREALARWPGIGMRLEDFRSRVSETGQDPGQLVLGELFLATACARGDAVAWEHFADAFLPALQRLARQACGRRQDGEDLAQSIVLSLMRRPEKIAGYDGRATLTAWLRVVVSRAAVDHFRRSAREVPLEETGDRGEEMAGPVQDPASALDDGLGTVLAGTLAAEIGRLPAHERLLLNLYYLEDVPLQAIGRQFGIHEATVSRQMKRLRSRLQSGVERELRRRHGLRRSELRGLWQQAAARGDFMLDRALGKASEMTGVLGDRGERRG
jgi:RNA polymerase sigma-70 factor